MIYLDNSATTKTKPKEVIKAVLEGLTTLNANSGRSGHFLSTKAGEKVFKVRQNLCKFLGLNNPERIIFTKNCTESLNLAILGTLQKGGHIICCPNAHNSLARPIFELEKKGLVEVTVIHPKNRTKITAEDVEKYIKNNTYLVAINHVSNVNGDCADIKGIGELCYTKCILFLLDCAQSAGHIKIDMERQHIDMLALAPHKAIYGPQGIGVFAFSVKTNVKPIIYGGTGTESAKLTQPNEYPECLESGTLSLPNILGLDAGIKFVTENFDKIQNRVDDLATYILFELKNIKNITVYTSVDNIQFGVIAFNINNVDSQLIADKLSSEHLICVRGGLHCAVLKHRQLGTEEQGIVRISLSFYNTFSECEHFVKSIKKIAKEYVDIK